MKKIILLAAIVSFGFMANAQKTNFKLTTRNDSVAYTIGINIGKNLKTNMDKDSLKLNLALLTQGFNDALNGLDTAKLTGKMQQKVMTNFQVEMQQKQMKKDSKIAGPNKEAGKKFLEENKSKPGVIQTASGLQYKVIKEGTGKTPTTQDKVTVNYEGKLLDGKVFDSSYDRNKPETFPVTGVIKGWTEALQLMKEGGTYELYISSDLGYGDQGNQGIPGGSCLIFKVDLIEVN